MIVLDTNVVSAMMRPDENVPAIQWLDQQDATQLRMTIISLHELAYGIALLPAGRKRKALQTRLSEIETGPLGATVLQLSTDAAHRSARARHAAHRATGHCDMPDAMVAGIALAHSASIATRNVTHFRHFGVPLINPWQH